MIGAQHALARRDVLAKERLGAGEVAALPQQQRRARSCWSRFRDARRRRSCWRIASASRVGASASASAAAVLQHPRQFDERDRDVLVVVAEQPPPHREALDEQRLGGGEVAQLALQHAEIVEALRDADVLATRTRARPIASACSSSGSALACRPMRW